MTQLKENASTISKLVAPTHLPRGIVRDNKSLYICDHCGKEVDTDKATKIVKGKQQEYVYCPECTKILYPTYKKVTIYNPNSMMNNILREGLARYEKLR